MADIYTPKKYFDEIAMRHFGKPYDQVDKREFARKYVEDYQRRHEHLKAPYPDKFEEWLRR